MWKVMTSLGIALAVAIGAAACDSPDEKTVQITDQGFVPDKIEVTVGQKVVWVNASSKEHTVTARGKAPGAAGLQEKDKPFFDSGPIKPAASWSTSFDKEGTYEYGCTKDKAMTGMVVVKPAP
ncbi:MAG TPA: plastocyanin/azurin family copper-binding protein [Planctomycetota bacterium]|nr:plastocyanin/azurin family copper-binding protein [Planctomycetota bacterium]